MNPMLPCPLCGSPAALTHVEDAADLEPEGVRMAVQCSSAACWLTLEDWAADGVELLVGKWNKRVA